MKWSMRTNTKSWWRDGEMRTISSWTTVRHPAVKIVVDCAYMPHYYLDGLGYHDDGEEHLGVAEDAFDGENCCAYLRLQTTAEYLPIVTSPAKKRLKDAAREGDNRLTKKARMLAESSQGPKGSILRHMQAGIPGAASRMPAEKKGSST